jgi:hypothetical protein
LKQKREKEEDERIRALPPKEREDVRKRRERLSGKFISLFLHLSALALIYLPSLSKRYGQARSMIQ